MQILKKKACTVFARLEAGIVGLNPIQGMDVWWVCAFFCVCVVLCLGRGLATSWSPVQGVLPSVNDQETDKSALCSKSESKLPNGSKDEEKSCYDFLIVLVLSSLHVVRHVPSACSGQVRLPDSRQVPNAQRKIRRQQNLLVTAVDQARISFDRCTITCIYWEVQERTEYDNYVRSGITNIIFGSLWKNRISRMRFIMSAHTTRSVTVAFIALPVLCEECNLRNSKFWDFLQYISEVQIFLICSQAHPILLPLGSETKYVLTQNSK
jgi:hypothetical protein